ncbi:MAG: SDR family oxidoreductase [Actinomycetota bacterium]|nr:SDR family oxidoreductase [Actinomycetota bacterium]
MDLELKGRRALVTGGSSGLGFATAAALIQEGVEVALVSRSIEKLQKAKEALGPEAHIFEADISTVEGTKGVLARVRDEFGSADIVVANSGGPNPGSALSKSIDEYQSAIEANLLSQIEVASYFIDDMKSNGFGRIIAITSLYVKAPAVNMALSNTARTGLTGYLKSLSIEVAPYGVTVNSLLPGLHLTDRLINLAGGDPSHRSKETPMGKLGDPESFGKIAAFIASKWSWYITGQAIAIDGGTTTNLM